MLSLPTRGLVYLIFDALDECPNNSGMPTAREEVLNLVNDLVGLRLPNLHICARSRPEIDIQIALGSSVIISMLCRYYWTMVQSLMLGIMIILLHSITHPGGHAPHWGTVEGVCLLLKHGAIIDAEDNYGKTPLQLALEHEHYDIATCLKEHGATRRDEFSVGYINTGNS
jgi:hypothetical protein